MRSWQYLSAVSEMASSSSVSNDLLSSGSCQSNLTELADAYEARPEALLHCLREVARGRVHRRIAGWNMV